MFFLMVFAFGFEILNKSDRLSLKNIIFSYFLNEFSHTLLIFFSNLYIYAVVEEGFVYTLFVQRIYTFVFVLSISQQFLQCNTTYCGKM